MHVFVRVCASAFFYLEQAGVLLGCDLIGRSDHCESFHRSKTVVHLLDEAADQ